MELDGSFKLMKPRLEKNKVGNTPNWENADEIDFSQVYLATSDSADTINAKLDDEGLHIVLQPGNYTIDKPIKVTKAGAIVLGIGMATLISASGNTIIEVGDVDDVRLAGFIVQAGPMTSNPQHMVQWGLSNYAGDASKPGVISDVFGRVGGPTPST